MFVCEHVHDFVLLQHLAIVVVDHFVLQQLCELTEQNAIIQPLHQTVCCEIHTWESAHKHWIHYSYLRSILEAQCSLFWQFSQNNSPNLVRSWLKQFKQHWIILKYIYQLKGTKTEKPLKTAVRGLHISLSKGDTTNQEIPTYLVKHWVKHD